MTEVGSVRSRRADASRNRDAILQAALRSLNANPNASIAQIAADAGISRITFYGHFSSREQLLDAVAVRAMERIDATLAEIDLAQGPWAALETMIQSQWRLVDELNGLVHAAEHQMPAERVHQLHAGPIGRVQALIQAGRDDGTFRTDQDLTWQTACFFSILHGAAAELRSGRLSEEAAARALPDTIHAILQQPL